MNVLRSNQKKIQKLMEKVSLDVVYVKRKEDLKTVLMSANNAILLGIFHVLVGSRNNLKKVEISKLTHVLSEL